MKKALFLCTILAFALSQTLSFADWSSDNVWHNPLNLGDGSFDATNYFGLRINTTQNSRIIGVHYQSNPYVITRIYASDGSTLLYSNDSGSNGWANFTDAELNISTVYYIVGVPVGTRIYNAGTSYPYVSTDFNVIAGISQGLPLGDGNTLSFEYDYIVSQTYSEIEPELTTTKLFLNDTEGNYTICDNSILNTTTTVNVSVADLYIWCDGNSENAGQTPLFFYSNVSDFGCYYGVGIYNITSDYEGNESFNASSITYWLNITNDSSCYSEPEPILNCTGSLVDDCSIYADNETDCPLHFIFNTTDYLQCYYEVSGEPVCWTYTGIICNYTIPETPLNITNYTYTICTDNSTLYNHDYYFANGSLIVNDRNTYCPYGCDNTSFNCNLTPLETGFYSFLIILGIVIFILFFDRYILRGRR